MVVVWTLRERVNDKMIFFHIFYRVAFLTTALLHLCWNDLVKAVVTIVATCLSNPRQPIIQSILRLHSLVLVCFVLAFCFHAASASTQQLPLESRLDILSAQYFPRELKRLGEQFDDIQTPDGFGNITSPYRGLSFDGFYAFDPSHPRLDGIISANDLNCATSKPNALYGTRDNFGSEIRHMAASGLEKRPSIQSRSPTETFTVHRLKMKPLDMPLGFVTIHLQGSRSSKTGSSLHWSVDFPAGFHLVLDVRLEEFSKQMWNGLERLVMWADFHYNDVKMDWEFCVDDIGVDFEVQ
ncbi:uncharacterized protein Z518_06310 [Rhinocladiella mackenziei CBS 650.93]|uniref:Uncharacterized protein n=1 Tax=Rhinocladiella mackenziei CBS 650.93 TaxID=1442369 RepID=A0A0D2H4W0_9EURO|nr:uncharacterized protein Z518_06310 [Rhinocladiella mackenziei CBS 650.93]KIX05438.1 hypothetical protein Z518_06310 [Rhinocladiella mackenziei CBS 650.93]